MKSFGKCTASLLLASMIVQSVPVSAVYASGMPASTYTLETASLLSGPEILERVFKYRDALLDQDQKSAESAQNAALCALELASSSPSILSRQERTRLIAAVGQIRQKDGEFPLFQPGKPLDDAARTRLYSSLNTASPAREKKAGPAESTASEKKDASSAASLEQPVPSGELLSGLDQSPLEVPAPAPVQPAPVYQQPVYAPVYTEPAPVYSEPAPVIQSPVYEQPAAPADFDEAPADWTEPSAGDALQGGAMDEMIETPSAAPVSIASSAPAVQPDVAVVEPAPVQAAAAQPVSQPAPQPVQSGVQPIEPAVQTPVQPVQTAPAAPSPGAPVEEADFFLASVQTSAAASSLLSSAVSAVEDSILSSLVSASTVQPASSQTSADKETSSASSASSAVSDSQSSASSSAADSGSSGSGSGSAGSSSEDHSDFTAEPSLPSDIVDIPDSELDFLLKPGQSAPDQPQQPQPEPPAAETVPPVSVDDSFLDFTEVDTPTVPDNPSGSLGSGILNAVTTPAVSIPNGMNLFVETTPVSSSVQSIKVRRLNTTVNRKLKIGRLGIINLLPDYTNSKAWKDSSSPYNTPSLWGQCTWFAWARFYEMYGFSPEFHGNGYDCVSQLLSAHGDKFRLSSTPAAGAVFSSDPAHNHVGIVLDYDAEEDLLTIQEGNLDGVSNTDWEEAIQDYRTIRLSSKDMRALYGNVTYAVPKRATRFAGSKSGTEDETSKRLSLKSLRSLAFEKLKEKVFIFDKGDKNDQQKAAPDENVPEDMSSE